MNDYIIRATAADSQIRAFAVTSGALVEEARKAHNTSPIATAALGRLLSAGSMMGVMLKGDKDILTLQIKGDGPIQGITVTADAKGRVKGYAYNPGVMLPPSPQGKLDVGRAVGAGILTVIKDLGLKEPYVGQTSLQTGEIGDDITYYFAASEQVPSSVGLGVYMEKNNTVKSAGGFIIQLMPFAKEEIINKLEENLRGISSVTSMLNEGCTPEMMLDKILGNCNLEIHEKIPTQFYCNCDKERVEKAIISIGKQEINEMIEENEPIEVNCHFCNRKYIFTVEELRRIKEQSHETGIH